MAINLAVETGRSEASANISGCADFRTFRNGDPLSR